MCNLAPLGIRCLNEEYRDELVCCASNQLQRAWNDLLKTIPIIGEWIPTYYCKGFEPCIKVFPDLSEVE